MPFFSFSTTDLFVVWLRSAEKNLRKRLCARVIRLAFLNEIYVDPSPELLYLRIHATPEVLISTIPGGHLLSRSALCFTQGVSGASSIYFLFGWHPCVAHHLPQIFYQLFSRGVQSLSPAAKLIRRGQASQSVLPEALVRYIPPTIESCSTLRSHPMG